MCQYVPRLERELLQFHFLHTSIHNMYDESFGLKCEDLVWFSVCLFTIFFSKQRPHRVFDGSIRQTIVKFRVDYNIHMYSYCQLWSLGVDSDAYIVNWISTSRLGSTFRLRWNRCTLGTNRSYNGGKIFVRSKGLLVKIEARVFWSRTSHPIIFLLSKASLRFKFFSIRTFRNVSIVHIYYEENSHNGLFVHCEFSSTDSVARRNETKVEKLVLISPRQSASICAYASNLTFFHNKYWWSHFWGKFFISRLRNRLICIVGHEDESYAWRSLMFRLQVRLIKVCGFVSLLRLNDLHI
jgi:hypothetical protein